MFFWLFAIAVLLPFALLAFLIILRICEALIKLLLPSKKAAVDKLLTPLYTPTLPIVKACMCTLLGLMVVYVVCLFLGLLPPTHPDR